MRSVVVVLPASMCAMIPMFRVFWRENLRGIRKAGSARGWRCVCGQKERAPRARAYGRELSRSWRYVLEVSMLVQRATRSGARMNGAQRGAGSDDSKGFGAIRPPLPSVTALRGGLAVVALVGALSLTVATFATVVRITVGTTARASAAVGSDTGWDRHGPALIVLALL